MINYQYSTNRSRLFFKSIHRHIFGTVFHRSRMFENLNTELRSDVLNSPSSFSFFTRTCEICFCHGSSSSSSHSRKSSDAVDLRQKTTDSHTRFIQYMKYKDICTLQQYTSSKLFMCSCKLTTSDVG